MTSLVPSLWRYKGCRMKCPREVISSPTLLFCYSKSRASRRGRRKRAVPQYCTVLDTTRETPILSRPEDAILFLLQEQGRTFPTLQEELTSGASAAVISHFANLFHMAFVVRGALDRGGPDTLMCSTFKVTPIAPSQPIASHHFFKRSGVGILQGPIAITYFCRLFDSTNILVSRA